MMVKKSCFLIVAAWMVSGCAVNEVITADINHLDVAEEAPPEEMLLDIGIVEFDDGVPEDNDPVKTGIYQEVRSAEVRYLPYHLKTTLQGTGHWGAVRVIPSRSAFTDVIISGVIEKSNGEYVELRLKVEDAMGHEWFEKVYETQTGISSYNEYRDRSNDPYQNVFNDFSNDLREYVAALPAKQVQQIRQVSELQFFGDMAPLSFGDHLTNNKDGTISIVRLPAENDPTAARLRQIRERDRLVVDTLNEHYANFYYGIAIPYEGWRKISREEQVNYRQVRRSAAMRTLLGVVVLAGSVAMDTDNSSHSSTRRMKRGIQTVGITKGFEAIMSGLTRRSEAKIHLESISELSESFGSEAAPMVITVQGETRRLTGTATAQYESWRRLLKQIYQAETGFSGPLEVGVPTRGEQPSG
ncbi:MAG: hypothetical protein O7D92_04715 [Proteobacteria bacterium]|nr:hypothetical protein [Pseudomonadota bacterium]